MALHLAHLHKADETAMWESIPAAFAEVMGMPCDQSDADHARGSPPERSIARL